MREQADPHRTALARAPWAAWVLLSTLLGGCWSEAGPTALFEALPVSVQEPETEAAAPVRPNVLLLCVDDLRPEIGCFGAKGMRTPHIDALASRGVRFSGAHCSIAICGPSRAAFLTGLRPETTGAVRQSVDYRDTLPDIVVMPELFKNAGWTTRALGKIHHGSGELDDERAWSTPCWRPSRWQRYYALAESREAVEEITETWEREDTGPRVVAWEAPDVPDSELPDGMIADEAIRFLREDREGPFFLAVGFLKPHLPFVAPKKYWDLYPEEAVEFSDAPEFPKGAPEIASSSSLEVMAFQAIREGGLDEAEQRSLIRGYRACVSFVDAQIDRVLQTLQEEGLSESTIVVLWGDHGWHLGDQGLWGKHTNYEHATRTPLIVAVPGSAHAGEVSARLVEAVDVYPTLAELCGLSAPATLEGCSFAPLLEDPTRPWKSAVFSEYHRSGAASGRVLGSAIRTERYRLVEWALPEPEPLELELYDLGGTGTERENLAGDPAHAELLGQLRKQLHDGWRAALPDLGSEDDDE